MVNRLTCCFFSVLGFFFFHSCKIFKQQDRQDQQSTFKDLQRMEYRQQWYNIQEDSLSRYWYFSSEDRFRFHPDSGIIAERGKLFIQESKLNKSFGNAFSRELNEISSEKIQKSTSDNRRTLFSPGSWLIGLIVLLLLAGWKFRKFFKTFRR